MRRATQPKCVIIAAPRRYRGLELEAQLAAVGVVSERHEGVVVGDADRARLTDDRATSLLMHRPLSNGELGCAAAHRVEYRDLVGQGSGAWMIVLEDDARVVNFGEDEISALEDVLSGAEPTVVMLFVKPGYALTLPGRRGERFPTTALPPTTTTAYALNAAAADILLDDERPFVHVPDWPIEAAERIRFRVSRDAWFTAADTPSTIGERAGRSSSAASRVVRRLSAVTHVRWLRHKRVYRTYRAYVAHELLRGPAFARGAREGGRLVPAPAWLRIAARWLHAS